MKKTLLLITVAFFSFLAVNAQKTWNFSDFQLASFTSATIIDGLQILAAESTGVSIDANAKKNGSYAFTQRIKLGGAGAWTPENRYMPTTRALVFNVKGSGTITVSALSSSSGTDRRLLLTNGQDSISSFVAPGSYSADGNNIGLETFNYTGGAATLYLYSVSSGVNIYLLDVSSAVDYSSVNNVMRDKGITISNNQINNPKNLSLEVFNMVGKKIAEANQSISTTNFQRGLYIVRIAGTNQALKFSI